ncbi:MAG TPA: alpha/beta hydrolase [Thermomicrobiaceae bacterium]|nr:alpha/beta hydrolase [Thermomicrobiaceae bacterium]
MIEAVQTFSSTDGTVLSYHTTGHGPGVIVIPGALAEAADLAGLAQCLASRFSVYTLDRRGRGRSGPQGDGYSLTTECDDVLTLQELTGARVLFGHSFGGLVALEAARNNRHLRQVVVYEPGVSIAGSVPTGWMTRCQAELDGHHGLDAFATFARGINPETAGKLPRGLFKLILRVAMRTDERRQKVRLLPAAIREHAAAAHLDNTYEHYQQVTAGVLLLRGGRGVTAAGATRTATTLATVLPCSRVVLLPRLDHFGPEKEPALVARTLLDHVEYAQDRRAEAHDAA